MIESRYSIEYVDPNSGSVKKSLGKLLIYTLLILSIILITLAILFSTLSENSSSLITRKIQEFSNIDTSINKTVKEIFTPDNRSNELQLQLSIFEQRNIDNKNEIERLSLKNANQLSAHTKLSTSFDELYKKLTEEKLKSDQLAKEVKILTIENSSISALLEEAQTIENQRIKEDELKKIDAKESSQVVVLTENKQETETASTKLEKKPTLVDLKTDEQTTQDKPIKTQIDEIVSTLQKQELSPPSTTEDKNNTEKNNADNTNGLTKTEVKSKESAVDAIVAAMQAEKSLAASNKNINDKKIVEKKTPIINKQPRTITVKKDETIWRIAERIYGNGSHYKKIIEANPTLDLKKIKEGMVLKIPN